MVYTVDEIRKMIKPIAIEYELPAVYLFGCYARGIATEESEINLFIESTGSKVNGLVFSDFYEKLTDIFGNIDVLTTHALAQYSDNKMIQKLKKGIMKESILIYKKRYFHLLNFIRT